MLSNAYGPPAWEEDVVGKLRGMTSEVVERSWRDNLGNLFVKVRSGSGPRVMMVAHMDEVAMIVRHVDDSGFLHIAPLGGLDARVLIGQRVVVHGNGPVEGCIGVKPPHVMTPDEMKVVPNVRELYVDVGASSRDEVRALGIGVGSYVTFPPNFAVTSGTRVVSKALDDRAGCAAAVEVSKELHGLGSAPELYAVFTVQEELGLRGASVIVEQVEPDLAVVLECTVAADVPGTPPQDHVTRLGQGAAIRMMDSTMLTNPKLVRWLTGVAEREGISYQLQVMTGGGTDAGRIHLQRRGVPTVVISTPCRYLHTPNLMLDLRDLEAVVRLTAAAALDAREALKGP
ncbi:MAG: M42 family metallopeptidase [Nitrososphaerota archaeon]|nr:M42 family metallopeptidase [Nitrososphaerota archaeon]